MINSLHVPDDPRWHIEVHYSLAVAQALTRAYTYIKLSPGDPAAYASALTAIEECIDARMSVRQRLNVLFVLAMAYVALDKSSQALQWLDESLHIAAELSDPGALTELLYLHGTVQRIAGHFNDSADDFRLYLRIVRESPPQEGLIDATLHLQVLVSLAGLEFLFAHFDSAEALLAEASNRARHAPEAQLEVATIAWTHALLERWQSVPDRALFKAMDASEVYTKLGSPSSAARIATVVAEIALDLASSFPEAAPSFGRGAYASLAKRYIDHAEGLARSVDDPPGVGVARLARARYSRVTRRSEDTTVMVEDIIRQARRLLDAPLLVQAFTALGDELTAKGEVESALNCYRKALDAANSGDVPALGMQARRALLQHSEFGKGE